MTTIFNLGGTLFETNNSTVNKIPYFRDMFEMCEERIGEIIFVDRPAHVFKHVLAFAIDPLYLFPARYSTELDFFGIDYHPKQLYDKNVKLHDKNEELLVRIKDLKEQVDNLDSQIGHIKSSAYSQGLGMEKKVNHLEKKMQKIKGAPKRVEFKNNNYGGKLQIKNDNYAVKLRKKIISSNSESSNSNDPKYSCKSSCSNSSSDSSDSY